MIRGMLTIAALLCSGEPGPCGIRLDALGRSSGSPGETLELRGAWGPTQGDKIPCMNRGGVHRLEVVSWSDPVVTVRIPLGLGVGTYKVGVYCNDLAKGGGYSSGWMDFTVVEKQGLAAWMEKWNIGTMPLIVMGGAAVLGLVSFMVRRKSELKG